MASIMSIDKAGKQKSTQIYKMQQKFVERIDVRAAQYAYSLSDDEFLLQFWSKDEIDQDTNKWDEKAYVREVKAWLSTIVYGDGTYPISYKFALSQFSGRQYCSTFGVQRLQHRLRSFLVRPFVLDVDMKNAHPTLLLYLCEKKYDLPCTYLREYVTSREKVLAKHGLQKLDILIALYLDKVVSGKGQWLKMLSQELVGIREWLHANKNHPDFEGINFTGGSKSNPKASILNRVLCKMENEVLMAAVGNVGRVDTLMFDGFHLDKGAYTEDTISTLNEATAEFGITWAVKPFDDAIKVPAEFDFDEWANDATDYQSVKRKLEKDNARILEPPMFISRPNDKSPYYPCNEKGFKHKTSTYVYESKKGLAPIYNQWMKDPHCRTYNGIDFIPDERKCPSDVFNLFTGFPRSLTDEVADTSIIHEHLREVVAAGDDAVYQYMLNYEAHMVQKPAELPLVAIVMKGEQGGGKDSEIDKLERLIGEEHCHRTSNISDMVGNFNPSMFKKMLYQLNELGGKDGFSSKESIKHFITANRYDINSKHKDVISHGNYLRLFILSNNHTPVEIPYDDRRFVVLKVSSAWKGNADKFDEFHTAIRDPKVMDAYYTELMQRDISAFVPKIDRPLTSAYKSMKQNCISDVYKMLRDNFEGDTYKNYGEVAGDEFYIRPVEFKQMYQFWMINEGFPSPEYPRQLVLTKINDIDGVRLDAKHRFGGGESTRCYKFNLAYLKLFIEGVFGKEED